jgi:hypothetical protein
MVSLLHGSQRPSSCIKHALDKIWQDRPCGVAQMLARIDKRQVDVSLARPVSTATEDLNRVCLGGVLSTRPGLQEGEYRL